MSTELATGNTKVESFKSFMERSKGQIASALPKHLSADRLARLIVGQFARTPALQNCTAASIMQSVMTAATLGLEPGVNGAGFLIPYKETCTFVPGWKGLVDLVSRSGMGTVFTGVIYRDQRYTYTDGARRDLVIHNETDMEDPDDITHAYAIGWVKGSDMPIIELWRVSKLMKHRDKYNKVGGKHYSFRDWEMYCRKVPLLQVLKYMPCSIEVQRAIAVANAGEEGRAVTIDGDFVESTAIEDEAPKAEPPARKAPETWPQEAFDAALPKWAALVASGKKTAREITSMAASKAALTDSQLAAIEALTVTKETE